MKCLVTGVAGFIGSHLAERLLAEGHAVRGVDNFLSGKEENLAPLRSAVDFVEGDVRDAALVSKLTEGVDWVFHLAALVSVPRSVEDPALAHDHNVNGTVNVLLAARERQVKKAVFASSAAVYGDDYELPCVESAPPAPASPYALHKWTGEQYAALFHRIYGLPAVCLRFFNVFGPRQDFLSPYGAAIPKLLEKILQGERPVVHGDGEQTRDFIHVDDVVSGLVLAAQSSPEAEGQVFNLGYGKRVSINQLVDKMLELLGSDLRPQHGPPRPGDVRHSQADVSRARQVIRFQPSGDALTGLVRAIDWYRENLG